MPLPKLEYATLISTEHVYCEGVEIPAGYRARAFRPVAYGDIYLDALGNVCQYENSTWSIITPRLILEKIPPKASTGTTEVVRTVNYRKATREELAQNLRFYYETESGGMRLFVGEDVIGQTDIRDIFVRY